MRVPKVGIKKPSNSPYWYIRYVDLDGEVKRESTKETNYNRATRVQHQKQEELKQAVLHGIKPTKPTPTLTLFALAALLLTSIKAFSEGHIKETTRRLKLIKETLGDIPVEEITQDTLNTYIVTRRAEGVTDTSIHSELSCLRAAFNQAIEQGKTSHYPYRKWRHGLKVKKTKDTYLTDTEIQTLMGKLDPIGNVLDRILLIICTTALRLSDAASLSWDTVNGSRGFTISKTNTTKGIYLPASVSSILEACGESEGAVCPHHYKNVQALSQAVIDRVGKLMGRKMGAHSFRRSIATYALRNGASIKDVQEMLGHSTPTMTLEYAKANSDSARAVVDSLPWLHPALLS